jgi:hypothetical protein
LEGSTHRSLFHRESLSNQSDGPLIRLLNYQRLEIDTGTVAEVLSAFI